MIDSKDFFSQPVKNDMRTCESIRKVTKVQRDNNTTGCMLYLYFIAISMLHYLYFKESNRFVAIDLRKQQSLGAESEIDTVNQF